MLFPLCAASIFIFLDINLERFYLRKARVEEGQIFYNLCFYVNLVDLRVEVNLAVLPFRITEKYILFLNCSSKEKIKPKSTGGLRSSLTLEDVCFTSLPLLLILLLIPEQLKLSRWNTIIIQTFKTSKKLRWRQRFFPWRHQTALNLT